MKKIKIDKNEEGITLVKYLKKIFRTMPNSLLQKLIRKKYFEINDVKATGKEVLTKNDEVSMYLSDETFEKYYTQKTSKTEKKRINIDIKKNIVYEDDNIIIINKPVGMLSQGDKSGDISVNTVLNEYISRNKSSFTPSVVNRLDRNTEGLIIFAKTYIAAKEISKMIKDNKIEKRYKATINGIIKDEIGSLTHLHKKSESDNKAILKEYKGKQEEGYSVISLKYKVLKRHKASTDVDIELITGKSHQIRAQFSYIGHPLISDKKYMDAELYKKNVAEYGCKTQKLICYKIVFGNFEEETLKYLSDKIISI